MNSANRPQLIASTFVNSLVERLKAPPVNTTPVQVAQEALDNLRQTLANMDSHTIVPGQFDLSRIIEVTDLDDDHKRLLCRLITQVFIGSTLHPRERPAINNTIDMIFADHTGNDITTFFAHLSQEDLTETVRFASLLRRRFFTEEDTMVLLVTIARVKERREEIYNLTQDLTKGSGCSSDGAAMADIILALTYIKPNDLDDVTARTKGLVDDSTPSAVRAEILLAIADIQPQERDDVLKHARPIIEECACQVGSAGVIKAFAAIESEEMRVAIGKVVSPLVNQLKGYRGMTGMPGCIQAFVSIPDEYRAKVVTAITPWVRNRMVSPNEDAPAELITAAYEVLEERPKEAEEIFAAANSLFERGSNTQLSVSYAGPIVRTLAAMDSNVLQQCVRSTLKLCDKIPIPNADSFPSAEISAILSTFESYPADKHDEVIEAAISALGDVDKVDKHLSELLNVLFSIKSKQERDDLLKNLAELRPENAKAVVDLTKALAAIPERARGGAADLTVWLRSDASYGRPPWGPGDKEDLEPEAVLAVVGPFLCEEMTPVKMIKKVPKEGASGQMQEIEVEVADTYGKEDHQNLRSVVKYLPWASTIQLLKTIQGMPKGQHAEILSLACGYINNSPSPTYQSRVACLQTVAAIQVDREAKVEYARVSQIAHQIEDALQRLNEADKSWETCKKRMELAKKIVPNDPFTYQIRPVLTVLHPLSLQECEEVISYVKMVIGNENNAERIGRCVETFINIDPKDRQKFVEFATSVLREKPADIDISTFLFPLSNLHEKDRTNQAIDDCIALVNTKYEALTPLIRWIDPQDAANVFRRLVSDPNFEDVSFQNFYPKLFELDPNIVTRAHNKIDAHLKKVEDNKEQATEAVFRILDRRSCLLLDEIDLPVVQRAIRIYSALAPETLENKKSPYRVYPMLENLREDILACRPPVVNGLQMNIERLREIAQTKPLTVGDLPNIDKLLLKVLLDNMKLPERKDAVERYLGIGVDAIEFLLLHRDNAIIPKLLRTKTGQSEDPIGSDIFYLYSILDAIARESTDKREGCLLTQQEERLVGFAYCLRECETGQAEALPKYYNMLPDSLRARQAEGKEASIEMIERRIDEAIRNRQESILEDDRLLDDLTGMDNPPEKVHQSRYLKNRLFRQMGLRHKVAFDIATMTVVDRLFDLPVQQLLDPVIAMYTPKEFIQEVYKSFNEMLKGAEGQKNVRSLLAYIQTKFPEVDVDTLLEEGDEFGVYTLTEEGAKKLLEARGYLRSGV